MASLTETLAQIQTLTTSTAPIPWFDDNPNLTYKILPDQWSAWDTTGFSLNGGTPTWSFAGVLDGKIANTFDKKQASGKNATTITLQHVKMEELKLKLYILSVQDLIDFRDMISQCMALWNPNLTEINVPIVFITNPRIDMYPGRGKVVIESVSLICTPTESEPAHVDLVVIPYFDLTTRQNTNVTVVAQILPTGTSSGGAPDPAGVPVGPE